MPAPLQAQAQPVVVPAVQVESQGADTVIGYSLPGSELGGSALVAAALQALPSARFGGYELPIKYVTLALPQGAEPAIEIQALAASAVDTVLQPAVPEVPPALDWVPGGGVTAAPQLPSTPAFVFRSGVIRGQNTAVIAISPIYQENGVTKVASSLRAVVRGAVPVEGDLVAAAAATAVTAAAVETVEVPVNAAALANSFKITVSQPGLQEVLYSQLGLASEPANLLLTRNGAQIAVEKAGDRLRFYTPAAGDRWNATSAYWLTLEEGPAIAQRGSVTGGPAAGAFEEGKWQDNRTYEPGYRGADGDHWFHKKLEAPAAYTGGTDVTQTVPVTVPVQTTLPLRSGSSTFSIIATDAAGFGPDCGRPYLYYVQGAAGGTVVDTQDVSWAAAPSCIKQATGTATLSTAQPVDSLRLRLNANGAMNTAALLEAVTWRRPVALDFQGIGSGAEFVTDAGAASFALSNLPPSWQLYDVTAAAAPKIVATGSGGSYTLNQAAGAPVSRYLLANLAGARQPTVAAHTPTQFGDVRAADAIYIGPAKFSDELEPLLALRRQQGFTPLFVDVQGIYDVYGYGQVSAVAIRNFLRNQSDWQNTARRISVVLAGDATYDPFGYGGIANETLVAAWMDEVDPYAAGAGTPFGEAACDACIAQLNGDNPLTGDNLGSGRAWFAADAWIGRLPVRNEQELSDVVAKLVAYDTAADNDNWRTRKIFLADNFIKALDDQQNAQYDYAGDFATLSDDVIKALPNAMSVRRIYYDPAPGRQFAYADNQSPIPTGNGYYRTVPRTQLESWRIDDVATANAATIQTLGGGAGLVAYNGHSNHFYYAKTDDLRNKPPKDGWLLSSSEVSLLANQGKPFVMLAMTCYTSQFVKPAANGTIDEWLIRAKNAGAIAVWGPTGFSVVSGHELLQDGFLKQLQTAPEGSQRLGSLIEAGYTQVLESGPLDTVMTFVLLGDPLTRARIPTRELYMPALSRH
ncbi:MAG: C25 family cysteine peptidase [Caldilineaceae bacterium]